MAREKTQRRKDCAGMAGRLALGQSQTLQQDAFADVCGRVGGQKMSRERYKAIIYREKVDKAGNVTLEKVTTSRWLTVTQIASSVGVTPQTMYRQIVDGGAMPFTRIGSQIRVSVDDFLKWMESCQCAEYERPGAL